MSRLIQNILSFRPCCQLLQHKFKHDTFIPKATMFWEADRKGGYKSKIKKRKTEAIKEGFGMLGEEMVKFKDEWTDAFSMDVIVNQIHGDYETVWKFDDQNAIDNWVVTSDSDHNEGKSHAKFELSRNNTGIFNGKLNTEFPKDGIIKDAGYCSIRSPSRYMSFKRKIPYEWDRYTHLLMRVRGDGRPYSLLLGVDRYFDVQWNDQYHFPLYTRGGPYWQIAKIPFSKFYLSSKGRIQDRQESVVNALRHISYMGITLADGWPGDFRLEIDYIACLFDANHKEHFVYELYQTSPYVHS